MHMPLAPNETVLNGNWVFENGHMRGDALENRIGWLTSEMLVQVANHPEYGTWEILYRDPTDGRYWELTYPQSGMQGGGPKQLRVLALQEASAKYRMDLK
ncbi:MAG: Imm27 family immunity protein [Flavobacteriales bacterium]